EAIHPPLLITFAQAIGMAVALPGGMAEKPGITMLRLQPAQAPAKQARGQAAKPGQLGRRRQLHRRLGMLVRHSHSTLKNESATMFALSVENRQRMLADQLIRR